MCDPISLESHFSDEMQRAVGLLFLTAGVTEATLGMQTARVIAHPNGPTVQGDMSYAGADISLKLRTIDLSVRLVAPDYRGKIEKITASIRRQFDHRNAIAHNGSFAEKARITVTLLKLVKTGAAPKRVFTAPQIVQFARVMFWRTRLLDLVLTEAGFAPLKEYPLPVH